MEYFYQRGKTYEVNIWIGLQPGYDVNDLHNYTIQTEIASNVIREYVEKGLCVTVTDTEFFYMGGNEFGLNIGLINYPRFPKKNGEVLNDAFELANKLMQSLKQFRCTVIDSETTYVLRNENMPKEYEDKP